MKMQESILLEARTANPKVHANSLSLTMKRLFRSAYSSTIFILVVILLEKPDLTDSCGEEKNILHMIVINGISSYVHKPAS